jgi:hypothetical protein
MNVTLSVAHVRACMQAFTSNLLRPPLFPRDCGRFCLAQGIQTSQRPREAVRRQTRASVVRVVAALNRQPHLSRHMVGRRAILYSHGWSHSMHRRCLPLSASLPGRRQKVQRLGRFSLHCNRIASNRPSTLHAPPIQICLLSVVCCLSLSAPPSVLRG